MPQRNGKNPIKLERNFGRAGGGLNDPAVLHGKPQNVAGLCPACKAEVPVKPGFRFSSLKCPQCGVSMSKK